MNILTVFAMPEEMLDFEKCLTSGGFSKGAPLSRLFLDHFIFSKDSSNVCTSSVCVVCTGIGKVNTAISLSRVLQETSSDSKAMFDLVFNFGTCAKLSSDTFSKYAVPSQVISSDFDLTAFGHSLGEIPVMLEYPSLSFSGNPKYLSTNFPKFETKKEFVDVIKSVMDSRGLPFVEGVNLSEDRFLNSSEDVLSLRRIFGNPVSFDMELASIAHVCEVFGVPFASLKYFSDDGSDSSALRFESEILDVASKNNALVLEILTNLLMRGN